ncbi:hypothetical protein MHI48_08290 [Paenibacillus sp. FSL H7-0942]|uniref:hypothetical protein n=2 Tax=Paenibacillus TaxID=44249 RepID=UPI00096BD47F|nr:MULTISPECIES: hypothetical protein [Paenibacillus]OMF10059.1 hypothetical protein BK129_04310 [Paenibacillus amylolyticus]OMF43288.1 hypothetical protein BK136_16315 [Paenibacillus amylolyticus]PKQ87877.1 hypothetical protein CXK86_28290 [Paenibacillus sp. BGI2013]WFA82601.1 hypothetical protein OGI70_16175 [Paenibacillus amylolyticus]
MKAKLRPEDIYSKQLSWLCIEPMLVSVRGRDMAAKTEIYRMLHEGQQALFLFYSYHNHTKSLAEFYWFSAYNIIEIKSWNGIKNGMHFFHLDEMVNVLEQIESLITDKNKVGEEWLEVLATDLDKDPILLQRTEVLYDTYQTVAQAAITHMNEMILQNRDMYLEIE